MHARLGGKRQARDAPGTGTGTLLQGPGGDLGIARAELVDEQPVGLSTPVVLAGIRVEQPEADPHVPLARPPGHHQDADIPGRGGRREQCQVERAVVVVDVIHAALRAAELGRGLVKPAEFGILELRHRAAGQVGLADESSRKRKEISVAQKVRDVMTTAPVALHPSQPLTEVGKVMREQGVGSVLVTENGQLKGLVTDRDIVVRAVADGRDPETTTVAEVCNPDLVAAAPDDDADTAVRRMREHGVRRIPVVEEGRAVGILSLGDMSIERDERSALADISAHAPNT
jgi:CBS domain-containing protein